MKLSNLRPCDVCNGKIVPQFYVVRMSLAFFKPNATNAVLGLSQISGSIGLAETLAPDTQCVVVAGDEKPELMSEFFMCFRCAMSGPIDLMRLLDRASERESAIPK